MPKISLILIATVIIYPLSWLYLWIAITEEKKKRKKKHDNSLKIALSISITIFVLHIISWRIAVSNGY